MVEAPIFDLNVPFGFDVARSTFSHSTRNTFLPPSGSSLKKVTDETVGLVNGEVSSLDKLSMAGCASKIHTPSQLAQMSSMWKVYIFEYHIPFQIIPFVTPFLQTVAIVNFIMEFFDASPDNDISECELEIYPLPIEMTQDTWFAVTTQASHVVMGGCFP